MAMPGKSGDVEKHGGNLGNYYNFLKKTCVRIFTPCSAQGLPISFSPLQDIPRELDYEEHVVVVDSIIANLLNLMDYSEHTDDYKMARGVLYELIEGMFTRHIPLPENVDELISIIEQCCASLPIPGSAKVKAVPTHINKLLKRLRDLSIGQNSLLFQGRPFSVDEMMKKDEFGRTPINIIYLNTLQTDKQIQFAASSVLNQIHRWMTVNPQESKKPRLVVLVDEASIFFPPYPKDPPAKVPIKRIMKECRKFHLLLLIASQNWADLDYKGLSQSGIFGIGQLEDKNDWDRIKRMVESRGLTREMIEKIPPGHLFVMDRTTNKKGTIITNKWLFTKHGDPVAPGDVASFIEESTEMKCKILADEPVSKVKMCRCPVCMTMVPEESKYPQFDAKEYSHKCYLCPQCHRWLEKKELI